MLVIDHEEYDWMQGILDDLSSFAYKNDVQILITTEYSEVGTEEVLAQ